MGTNRGYVKIYRQLQNHWLWDDKPFSKGQAWLDLVMLANHTTKKFLHGSHLIQCQRGQTVTSANQLAKRWGWGEKKVRTFIKQLETDTMIARQATAHYTIIEISNYDKWQQWDKAWDSDQEKDTQPHRQANNQANPQIINQSLSQANPQIITQPHRQINSQTNPQIINQSLTQEGGQPGSETVWQETQPMKIPDSARPDEELKEDLADLPKTREASPERRSKSTGNTESPDVEDQPMASRKPHSRPQTRKKENKNEKKDIFNNISNDISTDVSTHIKGFHDIQATHHTKNEKAASANTSVPYQQIVDLYHAACPSFASIIKITQKRRQAMAARWNEYGQTTAHFQHLFQMAEASDFLKGMNNRQWKATFDWLISNEGMAKTLEGNYLNRGGQENDPKAPHIQASHNVSAHSNHPQKNHSHNNDPHNNHPREHHNRTGKNPQPVTSRVSPAGQKQPSTSNEPVTDTHGEYTGIGIDLDHLDL
ncbi:hypothetical protein [Anoxynatronum buryatiense]|uniref:Uncharacterized protein n=1 Tax=Anoxynatronum buryatiense TaxID=489973 RepID=A0AA45WSM5_9CLOT|nr:hypothetical protein [Anoxynatronum buryatiense]SMP38332.1 hypothetical protein SAMN06296020_10185 [Anoxynatronum buryatiense]